MCPRCTADSHPSEFATARNCAFERDRLAEGAMLVLESDFTFHPDNWHCASLAALADVWDPNRRETAYGSMKVSAQGAMITGMAGYLGADESLDILPVDPDGPDCGGWILLTRCKRRGQVSSAVHVGDWFPAKPVTLALVERTIVYCQRQRQRPKCDGNHGGPRCGDPECWNQ